MQIHRDLDSLPNFKNAALTIGSFDGIHIGHRIIIDKVKKLASFVDGESVVVTFHPHPRQIIYPKDDTLHLISAIEDKIREFSLMQIDHIVIVPFSIEFSQQSPAEYIEKFLRHRFNPRYIVIGYDHRFGLNRIGDVRLLRKYQTSHNFQVVEIPKQMMNDMVISSTKIRNAVLQGKIAEANSLLGYPFSINGKVVQGQKIGTKLGFPTANVKVVQNRKLIPPEGIYAVTAQIDDKAHRGMLYIGRRPTLQGSDDVSIEVNLFDFAENIYGKEIEIAILRYLRADRSFESLDSLREQLFLDRESTLDFFSEVEETAHDDKAKTTCALVIVNSEGQIHESHLREVVNNTPPSIEVWVISPDISNTSNFKDLDDRIQWLHIDVSLGIGEAVNRGLQVIATDYYFLINADVEVTTGCLDSCLDIMNSDQAVAVVQPTIKLSNDRQSFGSTGAAGGWLDKHYLPFCRGRILNLIEKDLGQYDSKQEIFWSSMTAMMVRAVEFHKIGGFDATYFRHQQGLDLCWRIKHAGYKVISNPHSVVYHRENENTNSMLREVFLDHRNRLTTITKNSARRKLIWLIPLRFALDWLTALLFLINGKPSAFGHILTSHLSFITRLSGTLKARRFYKQKIESIRIGPPNLSTGVFGGSILWQYYFRRKRTFKDLPIDKKE